MTTSDDRIDKLARLERLRRLGVKRGAHNLIAPVSTPERAPAVLRATAGETPLSQASAPAILPGEPIDTPHGPAWVRTVRFPLAERLSSKHTGGGQPGSG